MKTLVIIKKHRYGYFRFVFLILNNAVAAFDIIEFTKDKKDLYSVVEHKIAYIKIPFVPYVFNDIFFHTTVLQFSLDIINSYVKFV